MTPPLNHHHSGAGLFRKEQERREADILGLVLLPVALAVIVIVALWLAVRDLLSRRASDTCVKPPKSQIARGGIR